MATITTLKSGNYTDTAVWSGGVVPVDGDKVTISKLGTATSRVTSSAISAGSGNVPVTAGTGTGLIGEVIEFDSRPGEYYELTTGFTASAGTAVVTPVLAGAIASGATLRNRGHKVKLLGTRVAGDDTTTGFTVNGVLYWDRASAASLQVKGTYTVSATGTEDRGTAVDPLTAVTALLLLNYSAVLAIGKYSATYAAGARCLHYGKTRTRKTNTMGPLAAGATSFTVTDATGWADGDSLLIFPTAQGSTTAVLEERTIAAGGVSGSTITITAGLTNSKLSGAYVANLTSNIQTLDFNASFGANTVTFTAGAAGLLDDKYLYNSEWLLNNTGFSVQYNCQGSSATGQPRQFLAVGSVLKSRVSDRVSVFSGPSVPAVFQSSICYQLALGGNAASVSGGNISGSILAAKGGQPLNTGINSQNPTRTGPITNTLMYGAQAFQGNGILLSVGGTFSGNVHMCGLTTGSGGSASLGIAAPGVTLNASDFAPFGMVSTTASYTFTGQTGFTKLTNCLFGASISAAPTYGSFPDCRVDSWFGTYYGGATNQHEIFDNEGYGLSDVSTRLNGDAALRITNRTTAPFVYSFKSAIPSGATRRVLCNVRRNATYAAGSMPSVTLSIPGVTSVSSAATDVADTWVKTDLSITNTTGSAQEITVTLSANGAANASSSAWFDGVAIYPFVQVTRWYGFISDEANPFRTVDPVTVLSESAALALSGISVNHTTDTITVTAARTVSEVYDYCCADWVANIASTNGQMRHISSDGVSFTTSYTVVVSGGGSIAGKYTDASGSVVSATVSGIVPGSRVLIVRTDTNAVLSNEIVAGTSHSVSLTTAVDVPVSVVVRKASAPVYYQEWTTTGTITPAAGFAATANQQPD